MIFCIITGALTNILVMTQKIWTLQPFCQCLREKIFLTQLRLKSKLLKHHLKQEVPIHWNSTYYTLEQLLEQEKLCKILQARVWEQKKKKEIFFEPLLSGVWQAVWTVTLLLGKSLLTKAGLDWVLDCWAGVWLSWSNQSQLNLKSRKYSSD